MNYNRYKNLLLLLVLFIVGGSGAFAQTNIKTVVSKELSGYDGYSYKAYDGVTLLPGFQFPNSSSTDTEFSATAINRENIAITASDKADNFVLSEIIKVEGVKDLAAARDLPDDQKISSYTYLDGMGRSIQEVIKKGSPDGYDYTQSYVYDAYGRISKSYLPYVSTEQNGDYKAGALSAQANFYNSTANEVATDTKPFSEVAFDDSPVGFVQKQGAYGEAWQLNSGHEVEHNYHFNAANEVHYWTLTGSTEFYAANELAVSELTDENGHKVITYTNKSGNIILEKKETDNQVKASDNTIQYEDYLETYYVYDEIGRVRYIVPPKAVDAMTKANSWTITQEMRDLYLHELEYDEKGRLKVKTVPGAGATYFLYDNLNRLVLVQNAKQREDHKWLFVKYDSRGRTVMEGVYTFTGTAEQLANEFQELESRLSNYYAPDQVHYEEPSALATANHFYTNQTFPTTDYEVLKVNYFDDYDFDEVNGAEFSYKAHNLGTDEPVPTTITRGFATGMKKKILSTNDWLTEVYFYDERGRVIQTQKNNQLNLSTLDDQLTLVYNFDGTLKKKKQYQKVADLTVENLYKYDHMGRIMEVYQKLNNAPTERKVVTYHYNKLGQLSKKKLYGASNNTLQAIDYRYNIRGWVTHINDSELAGGASGEPADVFGMELAYNTTDAQLANKEYFNGNIAAVKWQVKNGGSTGITEKQRSYTFDYDANNQLRKADFKANTGSGWTNQLGDYNVENMMYDHNGNMVSVNRHAFNNVTGVKQLIDELELTYSGNQLVAVNDASNSTLGFHAKNGAANATGQGYEYNAAGSMVKDYYKELNVTYNVVNKTASVRNFANNESIVYEYDGMANRLSKQVNGGTKTHYIDQFVYEGTALKYFGMPEGRIVKEGSAYKYEFFIADHQGNVRVSFEEVSGQAQVVQENHMYPFGLNMPGLHNTRTNGNDRFYNAGAEWQNDFDGTPNYYSTFFREYDPALGRFHAIDPKAMQFASWSPYQYGFNDPMYWNDPLGAINNPGFAAETWNMIENMYDSTPEGGRSSYISDGGGGGSFNYFGASGQEVGGWGSNYGCSTCGVGFKLKGTTREGYRYNYNSLSGNAQNGGGPGLSNGFEGGLLISDINLGLDLIWTSSFNSDGTVYKENLAYFVPDGLLILPNAQNGTHSSKPTALPLVTITDRSGNRGMYVNFGGTRHQILGVIHTHPNGNPYPTPGADYQLVNRGIPSYIMSEFQIREAYINSNGAEKSRRIGRRTDLISWPFY